MDRDDASKTKEELLRELQHLRAELNHFQFQERRPDRPRSTTQELRHISAKLEDVQHQYRFNQAFLEAVFDNIPDMIFVKDARHLRFLRMNRAGCELLGLNEEELLGKSDFDFFPAEEASFFTDNDRAVLATGKLVVIPEEPIHTKSRGTRYLQTKKVPIFHHETGEPMYLLGISEDVTEQKQIALELKRTNEELEQRVKERTQELSEAVAQLHKDIIERERTAAQLRASQKLNEVILDSLPTGICHINAREEILQANAKALEHFQETSTLQLQRSMRRIESRTVWEDLTPCKREELPGRLAFSTGKPQGPLTIGHRRQDGSLVWALYSAVPVTDPDTEEITGVIVSFLDITEWKQREAERKSFEAKLRHAQKLESLGILAGGIAHDFNNLLVGILGNADLALHDLQEETQATRRIQQIVEAATRASDLTKQMLAYSGRGKLQIHAVHISKLTEEISHLLKASIPRTVELHTELEYNLPCVEGDPTQLQQVLMNLLTNAAESYEGKSGTVTLRTGQTELYYRGVTDTFTGTEMDTGRYVFVEVQDHGRGMSKETQARIFDPFFTTKFTGRGLGLAAVLGIVRSHNGMIKISSEENQGTLFTVFFPVSDQEATKRPSTPPSVEILNEADWQKATILLVDDDRVVRSVARNMLESMDFNVLLAEDGVVGLSILKEQKDNIALVLLDLTMPRMGGLETFEAMRAIHPTLPIVLCSGYSQEEVVANFAQHNISGFLSKPFTRKQLRSKLLTALGESHLSKREE
ncbi:MAG: response regulator [Deltaproteobacteria bacterium]|nr:MAG: response regulator [Deltaproteobacteria bacterium]